MKNANEIAKIIDSGEALMVVLISQNFESEIFQNRAGKIQIITDGKNTMTSSVASGYLGRIVDDFNGNETIQIDIISWYNPNLITQWNFLTGLIGFLTNFW